MRYLNFLILVLLISCSGGGDDSTQGTVYYFDPSAAENGTGSKTSPYNTFAGITFESGTQYLIKRGTVLEEQITVSASGSSGNPIVIGAYGTGDSPVIDGSEVVGLWADEGADVYSNTSAPDVFTGRGNVTVDNIIQKFTTGTPAAGRYTVNSAGKVQIYGNPAGKTVRLSRRYFGIKGDGVSYITIQDLHIRQASLHGIHFEDSHNITVQNCRVEICGGAFIGPLQAGNGIEFGNSSSGCVVRGCTISEIFDSGITPQTYDSNQSASGFTFTGNTISKCGFAGIEVAVLRNTDKSGSVISGVAISGNTINGCGTGFSGIRYGSEGRGIKIAADIDAGSISGVVIERCNISSNQTGLFISGNTDTVEIKRSVFNSNGYGVAAYDTQTSASLKVKINSSLFYGNTTGFGYNVDNGSGNVFELYHNTFYDNSILALSVTSYSGTPVLKNNIFYASTDRAQIFSPNFTGYTITNNCFRECNGFIAYGDIGSPSTYSNLTAWDYNDGTNITTDPLFIDAAGSDFDIGSSSGCRGAGVTGTGVAIDYSGKAFNSATPSIGAFEY